MEECFANSGSEIDDSQNTISYNDNGDKYIYKGLCINLASLRNIESKYPCTIGLEKYWPIYKFISGISNLVLILSNNGDFDYSGNGAGEDYIWYIEDENGTDNAIRFNFECKDSVFQYSGAGGNNGQHDNSYII